MNQTDRTDEIALPVARIEAQDALFIEPLREYLEQNGCRVMVNTGQSGDVSYVICVGSVDFVKIFYEDAKWRKAKKLAVIYEGDEKDLATLRSLGVKQYYLDPKPLSERQTHDIFAFFFTGKSQSIFARKEPSLQRKSSVIAREPPREPTEDREKTDATDRTRIAEEIRSIYHSKHTKRKMIPSRYWRTWILPVSVFLLMVFTPVIFYLFSLGAGAGLLALSGKTLTEGNTRWTKTLIAYGDTYLRGARGLLSVASPGLLLVGQSGIVEDQDRLLSILSQVSLAESGVLTIYQSSKTIAGGILFPNGTTQKAGVSDVVAFAAEVARVSQYLGLVSAQLESLLQGKRFPFTTSMISTIATKALTKLTTLREVVGYTDKLLALYPRIAGFRKKQTFLVLLQNSMELRPTGGFIGSILVLSFLDGKVDSLEVQDVYTADGQLKGHVDPPLPIREILGQEHWYLRDSNWDPDFAVSGARAAWFYEKEMGQSVDGVIAVSLPMVTRLLTVTGPIELLDFNERISASNFFAKSLLYTETDFFPGSTRKKDFLGALTSALLTRVTTDRSLSAGSLLAAVSQAIQSRDLQFYFSNSELETLVTQWGWHGGVAMRPCQTLYKEVACIGDGIGIVDANLGINKVNFFVSHEAVSRVNILENGGIDHTLTVSVHNGSPLQTNGGGAYQSYTRFLLPEDVEVTSLTLDGINIPARESGSGVPPPAPYWKSERWELLRVLEIPFSVSPRQTKQLTIRWKRPQAMVFEKSATYQLTIRKQPGVTTFPWRVTLEYPQTWSGLSEGGVAKPGALEYNTDLTKDAVYKALFQKNL